MVPTPMDVSASLTGVAFDAPPCRQQSPHAGRAELSGLTPSLSAVIPALQVACECNGRGGPDLMLPETVTMELSAQTPVDGTIVIPAATGSCVALVTPGTSCNDVGEATVAPTVCM